VTELALLSVRALEIESTWPPLLFRVSAPAPFRIVSEKRSKLVLTVEVKAEAEEKSIEVE